MITSNPTNRMFLFLIFCAAHFTTAYGNYHTDLKESQSLTQSKRNILSASIAIDNFIQEFYVKDTIEFDIIVFGKKTGIFADIINEIGRRNGGQYSTNIKWFPKMLKFKKELKYSAIILSDQEDDLKDFNKFWSFNNMFSKKLRLLLYCGVCNMQQLNARNYLNYQKAKIDQFQYFLIDEKDKIDFVTLEWWNETRCNRIEQSHLNLFNKSTMKWQQPFQYVEKFTNFHGCLFISAVGYDEPYYDEIDGKFKGYMLEIFETIAKLYNFTPHFVPDQCFYPMKKCKYSEEIYNATNINVYFDMFFLSFNDLYENQIGGKIADVYFKFIIPPGELYTSYEKVLLPFDEQTWWFLIATFGAAFGTIFIVNFMPKKIKDIFYGDGIRIPAFNVIGTFFGIGQIKLPTNSFARIILITFILFCLVIRTAYQGVQFDMMTKEMRRKPTAQSIQQFIDENYTILTQWDSKVLHTITEMNEPDIEKRMVTYKSSIATSCDLTPSAKETFIFEDYEIDILVSKCTRKPDILDEVFVSLSVGIGTFRNHIILPALEKVMEMMTPFGIPQYLYKSYYEDFYRTRPRNDVNEPKVLFIHDLSFGFVIWLVACGVSFCCLLSEILTFIILKKKVSTGHDNLSEQIETNVDISTSFVVDLNDSNINNDYETEMNDTVEVDYSNEIEIDKENVLNEVVVINNDEKSKTATTDCHINQKEIPEEIKEVDDEADEIENLIQDFEIEIQKPRKVLNDEEIIDVALDFVPDTQKDVSRK